MPADRKIAQLPLFSPAAAVSPLASPPLVAAVAPLAPAAELVAGILRELDVERLTPLAALNLLASLKDRLR